MLKCKSCGKEFEYSGNKRLCNECRMKHNAQCVRYRNKQRGIESTFRVSEAEKQSIIKMALDGYAVKEITSEVNRKADTVRKILKANNIKAVKKLPARKAKEPNQFESLVIEYRKQGKGQREIARATGRPAHYIGDICRRWGYGGVLAERKTDDPVEYIQRYAPGFEYVSGWNGCDGKAVIRCKECGAEFERSMITLRTNHGCSCPECQKQKAAILRAQKQAKAENEQRQKQIEKQQRFWSKEFNQTAFKICPVCGSLFTGGKTYCSEQCRQQNKWNMKEGYRYQFPLEEVYQRDKGVCWLCGGLCDWNDKNTMNGVVIYGDNYPSRDHVIPKSKGGKNTWSNIRLAHRHCNSRKAAKIIC